MIANDEYQFAIENSATQKLINKYFFVPLPTYFFGEHEPHEQYFISWIILYLYENHFKYFIKCILV